LRTAVQHGKYRGNLRDPSEFPGDRSVVAIDVGPAASASTMHMLVGLLDGHEQLGYHHVVGREEGFLLTNPRRLSALRQRTSQRRMLLKAPKPSSTAWAENAAPAGV
jgi:hypothetical protein